LRLLLLPLVLAAALWPGRTLAQIDGPHTEIFLLGGEVGADEAGAMDEAGMASLRLG